jgi:lipoprotein-releasing system ATP-binding protein
MKILESKSISKYFTDPVEFQVLKNISFDVNKGEFMTLVGKSGSGKSTLLYVLSTMDTDYSGELIIDGQVTGKLSKDELAGLRNEKIGFVFQFHYLLSDFTSLQNVMLPALKLGKLSHQEIEEKAYQKLAMLGLSDQAMKLSSKLSGGQQQRVAIARAIVNDPAIIMADEPTGNLDSHNAGELHQLFIQLRNDFKHSFLIVTHNDELAKLSDRVVQMKDGKIIGS